MNKSDCCDYDVELEDGMLDMCLKCFQPCDIKPNKNQTELFNQPDNA